MNHPIRLLIVATLGFMIAAPSRCRGANAADYESLLGQVGPSIVTIKFLLKMNMGPMGGGPIERETEINGLVISETGLIVCSNTQLSGPVALMKHFMRGQGGDQFSSTPTEIKVLIGDDDEGIEAEMFARDSEIDLAWIKIKNPGDKKFTFIDPAKGEASKTGDEVFALKRMGRFFDRATVINETRIGGLTKRPRELYAPASMLSGYGTPFFTATGRLAGIAILQLPGADEAGDDGGMGMMFSMSDTEMLGAMILPAHELARATKRALEHPDKPAEDAAEAAGQK